MVFIVYVVNLICGGPNCLICLRCWCKAFVDFAWKQKNIILIVCQSNAIFFRQLWNFKNYVTHKRIIWFHDFLKKKYFPRLFCIPLSPPVFFGWIFSFTLWDLVGRFCFRIRVVELLILFRIYRKDLLRYAILFVFLLVTFSLGISFKVPTKIWW